MIIYQYPDYMYHYGVKGMKWGVRRAQLNSYNPDYSSKQRKRDERIYGKRASKRVNKKMNDGESIQSARHYEVQLRDRRDRRKKMAKKAVKKGAALTASLATAYVSDQLLNNGKGTKAAKKVIETGANVAKNYAKMTYIKYKVKSYNL